VRGGARPPPLALPLIRPFGPPSPRKRREGLESGEDQARAGEIVHEALREYPEVRATSSNKVEPPSDLIAAALQLD
jgi:hypothetical protein